MTASSMQPAPRRTAPAMWDATPFAAPGATSSPTKLRTSMRKRPSRATTESCNVGGTPGTTVTSAALIYSLFATEKCRQSSPMSKADAMLKTTNVIDALLHAIETADVTTELFTDDVVLDATVPNWRFEVRGRDDVTEQLRDWFADPGHFETVRREPLPHGELVDFTLHWNENGIPHACHQAHILELSGGGVTRGTAVFGGRLAGRPLRPVGG